MMAVAVPPTGPEFEVPVAVWVDPDEVGEDEDWPEVDEPDVVDEPEVLDELVVLDELDDDVWLWLDEGWVGELMAGLLPPPPEEHAPSAKRLKATALARPKLRISSSLADQRPRPSFTRS